MRFIRKGPEPAALRKFKVDNKATPEVLTYSSLPAEVRSALYACMLVEQGKLCAYTMMPIGREPDVVRRDFHIEHIQPRSRQPERELDYSNLVLCAPNPERVALEFGAIRKAHAEINEDNFVSPVNASCETRLRFGSGGDVRAESHRDAAAVRTIDLLGLNYRSLSDARSQAIGAQGLGPLARKAISAAEARRLVTSVMKADAKCQLAPFCVAIRQVAERFARQSEAHAARVKGAAGRH